MREYLECFIAAGKLLRTNFPHNRTCLLHPFSDTRALRTTCETLFRGFANKVTGPERPFCWRGGRVVEGARLESVYTGNRIAGSNPAPSAIYL
jgi:hypothetical protein